MPTPRIIHPQDMTPQQRHDANASAWGRIARAHDKLADKGIDPDWQRKCAEGARKRAK